MGSSIPEEGNALRDVVCKGIYLSFSMIVSQRCRRDVLAACQRALLAMSPGGPGMRR